MTNLGNGPVQSLRQKPLWIDHSWPKIYEACVVGAGPAGIAVVGNLIDQNKTPILWIDEEFQGGRLSRHYREVPSNTRVRLFVDFADALSSFQQVVKDTKSPNAYCALRDLPQGDTCHLERAADLCQMLTEGLDQSKGVYKILGAMSSALWLDNFKWKIIFENSPDIVTDSREILSNLLILCTGSFPKTNPLPVSNLEIVGLDTALKPSLLSCILPKDYKSVVAVIGASHSAVLVLRNLYNLACSTHPSLRIKWFTRHPIRYAEERDGWILRDNTGLKGEAALWARDNLEEFELQSSDVCKYMEKVVTKITEEDESYKRHLPTCSHVIQAIGFHPREIPIIKADGKRLNLHFNHDSQTFEEDGKPITGLYGAGIAWPEKVTDPEGNVSLDVGMWKFMRSAKKAVTKWHGA